jgi:hypothetical protein
MIFLQLVKKVQGDQSQLFFGLHQRNGLYRAGDIIG